MIQIVICEDANAGVNDTKKTDLAQKILADVGSLTNTPVNDFNKKVLSDLANAEFTGDVDDKAVETAEKLLTAFLDETWADQPQAHKYVIGASSGEGELYNTCGGWQGTIFLSIQ